MSKIYILSGLGVDERVFQHMNFSGLDITFIKWISPLRNEPIARYAKRLSGEIREENPILVGLSFGGMMAIEIAKHIRVEKLILIASAKTRKEIPFYYRALGAVKLQKAIPVRIFKQPVFMSDWFFGAHTRQDKLLLREILKDTDEIFLSWAIDHILSWKNETYPEQVFHIHGTADRVLPYRYVKADLAIPRGGHFMTMNRAHEMSIALKSCL